jgi:transposase
MVSQLALACKKDLPRFLMLPWSEACPEYQALDQSLAADHLARVVREGMTLLDPQLLRDAYAGSGSLAYPPERLLAVVLYEYQAKRPHPSQWFKDAKENSAVRWLLQGLTPSRTVWYDFRRRVSEEQLLQYQQTLLKHARAWGMTTGQSGALDGTLVAANASRHHLAKQQKVQERMAQLDAAIARDQNSLPVEPPAWMGKTAARRLQQQDQYRRVGQRMEQLQEKNRQKRASKRQDPAKIRVSISDPDAAVGYDKLDVFRPLYNLQLLADTESNLVLAYDVFAQCTDAGTLQPLLERHRTMVGCSLQEVIADAGYASGEHLAIADLWQVTLIAPWQSNDYTAGKAKAPTLIPKEKFTWHADEATYYCPEGHRLEDKGPREQQRSGPGRITLHMYQCPKEHCQACPRQPQCTTGKTGRTISRSEHEELIDALKERMKTPEAKAKMRKRGATVERLNADFKEHRGLERLSGRGLKNAKIEVGLLVLSHNLRCVARHQQAIRQLASAAKPEKTAA